MSSEAEIRAETLADRVARQAVDFPHATAIAYQRRRYSYLELHSQIEAFAAILSNAELGTGQQIGVQLPNSNSAVIALLAVFRIGGLAVSLNPLLRPKETAELANRSHLAGLILTRHQLSQHDLEDLHRDAPSLRTIVVIADEAYESSAPEIFAIGPGSACAEKAPDSVGDEAIMIYTSGTTGASKGVVLTHSGLMAKSAAAIEVMRIAPEDRALMTLPACHVFSLTRQLFPHLMQGSEVHIVAAAAPPDLLNHVIDTQGVTTFSGVPYHFRGMLMRGAGRQYPMRSLRLATSSSMGMPGELREALARAMPQTRFLAQYGITETSGLITSLPAVLFTAKPDSVGRVVPGVELQIAERSDSPAACGEVLIRGAGAMSGYYRNSAATASALTSDGWFVTGDMGRVDADGDLTLIGRKAFVVKRAGEFILPEEVEAVLNQHPGVAEACVFGAADKLLGESLKACVVLRDSAVRPVEISRYCRENLASFKVPDEITVTAEFAKTSVGKIDKRAVVAAYWASHDTATGGWLP